MIGFALKMKQLSLIITNDKQSQNYHEHKSAGLIYSGW